MSAITIPVEVMAATKSEELESHRTRAVNWRSTEVNIGSGELTDVVLADLQQASQAEGAKTLHRALNAIADARKGDAGSKTIPSFQAAPEMLLAYLRENLIDGWVYKRESDGHYHPALVTDIKIDRGRMDDEPYIEIKLTSDFPYKEGRGRDSGTTDRLTLRKGDVAKKKPDQVLLQGGLVHETQELRDAYQARLDRFADVLFDGFAKQYRFNGTPKPVERDWAFSENARANRKVVHDVSRSEVSPLRGDAVSILASEEGTLPVPVRTVVRVFDLRDHKFYVVNVSDLDDYVYDKTLREKLVLPDDQRELLDVLTTDLSAFKSDIVEGKSAGNVVLAKGQPGVGKTLTAEVYSELIERPLYSIHSGVLGTTAPDVRQNLEEAFSRAQRWGAVLLLDEADVFVLARGTDITQNAVCAEFLRTLEYFDGLLFMTTNRSDDIDDAIISRCAALIDYKVPGPKDARLIWKVLAAENDIALSESLLDALIEGLPTASPRDIKMLLRLTVRMAVSRGEDLSAELFARCAMFRGLHFGA